MTVRVRAALEGFRGSLFYTPLLYVLAAVVASSATLVLDATLENVPGWPPIILAGTVASARALLSTIAGATIAFAGVAFSVSLLLLQLASSQFSPRVLYSLFRDPFGKRVMGIVVGTFTYCLLVLRAVRESPTPGGHALIPYLSLVVAVALGILAILAIVAFIDHSAHSMEVGEITRRLTVEAREQIDRLFPQHSDGAVAAPHDDPEEDLEPPDDALRVVASGDGWVQQIDLAGILDSVPEGSTIRLATRVGAFVVEGMPLCEIWPTPDDAQAAAGRARGAIRLGGGRTMQQDAAFGIRKLVDIALRALSPGINDPTTAQEVIVHLGALLRGIFLRDLPPLVQVDDRERRLLRPFELRHGDYLDLAFDQIRQAGAGQPAVMLTLLETLGMLDAALDDAGLRVRRAALTGQAALIVRGSAATELLPDDVERIRRQASELGLVVEREDAAAAAETHLPDEHRARLSDEHRR